MAVDPVVELLEAERLRLGHTQIEWQAVTGINQGQYSRLARGHGELTRKQIKRVMARLPHLCLEMRRLALPCPEDNKEAA